MARSPLPLAASLLAASLASTLPPPSRAQDDAALARGLLAHWPLVADSAERIGIVDATRLVGTLDFSAAEGTRFDGRSGELEVDLGPLSDALGSGDFTIALSLCAPEADGVPGDLIAWRDFERRHGLLLSLKTNPGVTTSEPNRRHLQFSIDDGRAHEWIDRGRPGGDHSILAFALAVHEGALYAGTCEPYGGRQGGVYRLDDDGSWVACGAPDLSNSVTSLIVHEGVLHAGTGKYRVAGSSLPESDNEERGGRVFRYLGGERWEKVGEFPETEAVGGFGVYGGRLHASSLYRPAGFFRLEADGGWTSLPLPEGPPREGGGGLEPKRVQALAAHDGSLCASSYDGGRVYRWDGTAWTDLGQIGEDTQTYSFAILEGRLLVGMWPSGKVYRLEVDEAWTDLGRLGEELEVMGMTVHHGRLVAGTLPLAEVYEYRGEGAWERHSQLDHTPDVRYRRAWTMAEHSGEVYVSTLPSGRVFSWRAGAGVAAGRPLGTGWHSVAATRSAGEIALYIDGERIALRSLAGEAPYELMHRGVLRIGGGPNSRFKGQIRDLRIYGRVLDEGELRTLAGRVFSD